MDDLPELLLMEVLLRLPYAALHRSKAVCKTWHSVTSTPYFLGKYESYASRGSTSPRWAFVSSNVYDRSKRYLFQAHELLIDLHCGDLKCPIPNPNEDLLRSTYRVLGVSNGLVLYEWLTGDSGNDEQGTNWGVCDPVTRRCVVLPPCMSQHHHWRDSSGFLTKLKDGVVASYTVVKYVAARPSFEVFSSETGEWKAYPVLNMHPYAYLYPKPTDLDGILHWMHSWQGIYAHDPHGNPRGALRDILLPTDRDGDGWKEMGGVFGMCGSHDGHLRYLECTATSVSVWVLDDYGCGDNWLLQHRANYTNILKDICRQCKRVSNKIKLQPVSFHPFYPDVVYLGCDQVFISCNMRERKCQVLQTFRGIRNGKRSYKWGRAFCLVVPPIPPALPPWSSSHKD